jgi:hypothetical protein
MNTVLKTRAKLSVEQVIEIFNIKDALPTNGAARTARMYGVSEKTVRDIWSGRTWCDETCHLDTSRVLEPKSIGRPKGCRDSKPRKQKRDGRDSDSCMALDSYASEISARAECGRKGETIESPEKIHATLMDVEYGSEINSALHMAQSIAAPSCYPTLLPQALAPAPNPSQGASAQSVDQQLQEWGQSLWLDLETSDPFREDWKPEQEGATVSGDPCAVTSCPVPVLPQA